MTGFFAPALSVRPRSSGETSGAAAAVCRNSRRVLSMEASGEQGEVRLADAVARDVDRPFLGDVGGVGRDAERMEDRRVQVLDADRVLDGRARPLVGGAAV